MEKKNGCETWHPSKVAPEAGGKPYKARSMNQTSPITVDCGVSKYQVCKKSGV